MKIFLITHTKYNYDAFMGHVIVANNRDEVVSLAKGCAVDEGKEIWHNASFEIQGEYTGVKTEPFILLSDFNAG